MTTVVNNPGGGTTERVVESSGGAGWAVAVILLIAVIGIGGFVWMRYYGAPAAVPATENGGTNINVTLPPIIPDNSGGTNPPAETPVTP